ncbi:Por secretion system C-terminal sorting domain-containing protein [Polaribacter sp. KT25b]|uniref:CotH kinase family protein n=1 Tax=Polaribacter sp. KT25b TaxID=1855336 RepID=UPI0008793623|nr:CotH kinase family protein [Polaribacter sp. KT25b]SDS04611.1 Por secretion system C-terminal sorting domain-containing protein [Polaribacter sp. KT25b]
MPKSNISIILLFYVSITWSQEFISSNLPIIIITTDKDPNTNNPIPIIDKEKVMATMKIIYRPDNSRNYLDDQNNPDFINYNGKIGIEFRGSTSQSLPKKPYSIETRKEDGSNNNVKILGLPKENDWVLNSLAYDKTLLRDFITYELAREMGNYASRGKYCEVIINDEYKGLYIVAEKIKIDSDRINIVELDTIDNSIPSITGGYFIKTDKTTGDDSIAWQYINRLNKKVDFIFGNPEPTDITFKQSAYIKSIFDDLSTTTANQNGLIKDGYPSLIDLPSFIDFIILNELTSNVDAYKFSTFFHKDRAGKLRAGPIWDFNFSFGNDNRSGTDIWQFDNGNNIGPDFWKDLFDNPTFNCYLRKRWNGLIKIGEPLEYIKIEEKINSLVALLSEAKNRENQRWGTLSGYELEISNLKLWLQKRYIWLNENLGNITDCSFPELPNLVISEINYHPKAIDDTDDNDLEFIAIVNNSNIKVNLTGFYFRALGISYQFPDNKYIDSGQKIYLANNIEVFENNYGFPAFGEYTRNLSNKSQQLLLTDAYGSVIDEVTYTDDNPWKKEADGDGFFLILNNLNDDNSLAANWNAIPQTTLKLNNTNFNTSIYPNPIENLVVIENNRTNIIQLTLYNLQGKKIISVDNNSHKVELRIENLPKSIYLMKIILDNKQLIYHKIIKE